jgi:type IV pilus assembly protein PilM
LLEIKPKGFGLEIEDGSLKAIMIKKTRKGSKVISCAARKIKKDILHDGQIISRSDLAQEIKVLLASAKPKPIKSKHVVFSIPESKSFVRTIQIPKMTRKEASEAIVWETEANIPVSADKVYLDWQVVASQEKNEEVLVVAVPKEIIDAYYETIRMAGLVPLAAEVDIIANIRSLTAEKADKTIMIIDVGADVTSMSICKNQVPYFTSSLPVSGKTFTDAVQKGLGVSWEKAEELKAKYGLGKMEKDDMLYNIYIPLIENLAGEIEKSLVFYAESINSKEEVNEIIISGGGALLRHMADYLEKRIGKKVTLGNPAEGLGISKDLPNEVVRDICPFATAVGLAIKASDYNEN